MFTVNTKEFKNALEKAVKFTAPKSTLPILQTVKIDFDGNNCNIFSTDLEFFFGIKIAGNGDIYPAKCVASVKEIIKTLALFDHDTVIDFAEEKVIFTSGKKSSRYNYITAEEYPPMPDDNKFTVKDSISSNVYKAWKNISYARSTDNARPMLTMCRLNGDHLVTTDGFRIAKEFVYTGLKTCTSSKLMDVLEWFGNSCMIAKTAEDYKHPDGNIDNSVKIWNDSMFLIWAGIDGNYPDTEYILKQKYINTFSVNSKDLLEGLKYLLVGWDGGKMIYNANKKNLSVTWDETSKKYEIDMGNIAFACNPVYMKEIVENQFKSLEEIDFSINYKIQPLQFSNSNFNKLAVVMPMTLLDGEGV